MFQSLRKRLIFTYTLSTCLLLTVIVAGAFLISRKQADSQKKESFNTVFRSITETVMNERNISHTWLKRMESRNRIIIQIYSNGVLLEAMDSWIPSGERTYLFQRLRDILDQKGIAQEVTGNQKTEGPVCSFYGDKGGRYYGRWSVWSQGGHYREVYVIQYPGDESQAGIQLLWYFLLDAVGCAVLFFICRLFVERTLRPLENGLRRQKEFIAAASHELRSPLTVIRAGLHAIKEEPLKGPELIPGIDREGERMGRLIQDMLLLASSDAGTWTIRTEVLQPDTLLISICDTLTRLCREKKQRLLIELPEDEVSPINGDRERLVQILIILVDNASAYSPEGSEIKVSLTERKKSILFEVVDHGQGIKNEDKEQIFERFYRADSSRREKQHFGLGLSIAWELVRLQHGKISAADTPGGGSTFAVELPSQTPVQKHK